MTRRPFEAVVIGTSAGAIDALSEILPKLPATYHCPIMVVVHLPADKKSTIADLFQSKCKLKIKEAEDKEPIVPGFVYFAPPNYHILVEPDKRLSLSTEEPVLHSRPSIDVLFETAAEAYGPTLLGIILTGANSDGANGLRAIIDAGGSGIIQDPSTSYVSTMPAAAFDRCPSAEAMTLSQIAAYLNESISS